MLPIPIMLRPAPETVWYIQPESGGGGTPSSSASPSSTSSAGPTPSQGSGVAIHPQGQDTLCMTVQNGYAALGTNVEL